MREITGELIERVRAKSMELDRKCLEAPDGPRKEMYWSAANALDAWLDARTGEFSGG